VHPLLFLFTNGVGKTMLLRVLTGAVAPDTGTVNRFLPVDRWGILHQDEDFAVSETIADYVRAGHRECFRLYRELEGADGKRLERCMRATALARKRTKTLAATNGKERCSE
jgi:ATPase subunit of ABC transporter with duplicated ATPase domains